MKLRVLGMVVFLVAFACAALRADNVTDLASAVTALSTPVTSNIWVIIGGLAALIAVLVGIGMLLRYVKTATKFGRG